MFCFSFLPPGKDSRSAVLSCGLCRFLARRSTEQSRVGTSWFSVPHLLLCKERRLVKCWRYCRFRFRAESSFKVTGLRKNCVPIGQFWFSYIIKFFRNFPIVELRSFKVIYFQICFSLHCCFSLLLLIFLWPLLLIFIEIWCKQMCFEPDSLIIPLIQ